MVATKRKLPHRVTIQSLISSRYAEGERPGSWDNRVEGMDVVRSTDGEELKLWSDGGQTPPKAGWVLMLIDVADAGAYRWTLYGLPSGAELQ